MENQITINKHQELDKQLEWEKQVTNLFNAGFGAKKISRVTHTIFHPEITLNAERCRVERLIKKLGLIHSNSETTPTDIFDDNTIENNNSIDDIVNKTGKVEYKSDGSMSFEKVIAITEGEPITPEIVMTAHNLDPNEWDVVTFRNNFWQSQAKGGKKISLYQSKITVKPKIHDINVEELKKHFESFVPSIIKDKNYDYSNNSHNTMMEINICDLHLGKLAWNGDTGEDYDYKIALQSFNHILQNNIRKIKEYKPEKILFVWCNDFFNADGLNESTTGGTPQSCDLRWQKLFMVGCELLVTAIETLEQYAPVESFYIASNHARQAEFYALCYLDAWFRKDTNVTIHMNCKSRYYYKYGINMIGFSHSSYEKKTNLKHLMSVEMPEMWAATKYREFHFGHYHKEMVDEEGGVIMRWLPAMTGTDNYHYDRGYLGAIKRSFSFVWHKDKGLIDIVVTSKF